MPSLKDLRNRIRSVRSTQKITSAMKMVAASRLRRAQEQAEAARPYAQRMEQVLSSLAGRIKLELAQYREMAAFSQFASDLDASTQRLLARGSRLTELLKQPQFSPVPVEEQVVVIFAGTRGYLDRVDVADVTRFEQQMLGELRAKRPELLEAIRTQGEITEDTEKALAAFFDAFSRTFA